MIYKSDWTFQRKMRRTYIRSLDERFNFTEYITSKTSKCDKLTGISKNCQSGFK